ncbi:DUF4148 domain-containing protein [Burkholderia sp. Bp8963]|uniref:DUF4148 domain-containing protein n=1 Tax=Burkholderia sp. Bp8963 TaxID=2184547 RepID=UPI000F5B2D77|nr:DUF4148 domain-containing protein [Burkholderia sp. Bp8963]RQS67288.1 DUF4148 domain-containing protein [Burkholderia sp. Bp8963]
MNVMRLVVAAATAAMLSPAFAQTDSAPPVQGKTRAEVVAELNQAYLDGDLPTTDSDYPPSDATRARNRELLHAVQPAWAAQTQQPSPQQ